MELTIEERVKEIERRLDGSGTFSPKFWWRAMAIVGHMLAVNLAFYAAFLLLMVLIAGIGAL